MKLSTETVCVLKNFSSINSGIFFQKGTKLSTISQSKTVLASATIKEDIPQDFGIYDLNDFLSVLSLGKDTADLDFDSAHVIVKALGGRSRTKYRVADKSMIVTPDKAIVFGKPYVTFTISEEDLAWIMKNANVLQSPNIAVIGENGVLKLVCLDTSNDSANQQEIDIGTTTKEFKFVFITENIKLIPGAYVVEIAESGISHFVNTSGTIEYWVTTEKKYNKVQ